MEVSDLNGVFINHRKLRKGNNGKDYVTFSIAYSQKVGKSKFKTSFVPGIAAFPNVVKKIMESSEDDRFVIKGKLNSNPYTKEDGSNASQIVVDVHTITKVERMVFSDPYADPSSSALQDDPYDIKNRAAFGNEISEEDIPF